MKTPARARLATLLATLPLLACPPLQAGLLGPADAAQMEARFPRKPREAKEAEILVKFRDGVTAAVKDAKHLAEGNAKLREFRRNGMHQVKISPAQPVEEAVQRYAVDANVQFAEPNFVVTAQALPNDPGFALYQWNLNNTGQTLGTAGADVKAPLAWDRGTGADDVVVMVIDSGIDYRHPDLAANMWVNPLEVPGNGIDDDNNGYVDDVHGIDVANGDGDPMDDFGHGTHVAGIIGAVGNNGVGVAGMNWRVKLIACKILDNNGEGFIDRAVECLDYARALRARGVNIVATNNSYGGLGAAPETMADAIAAQPDILFVAAAGNFALDNDRNDFFPGNFALPNLLSVAATDHTDALAGFSDFGRRTVHLGAPGVTILSTMPNGTWTQANGTSMAAPHVAGLVALLKAHNPALDWRAIRNLMLASGDPVAALQDKTLSGRRLNAGEATACANKPLLSALKLPAAFTVGAPATLSVLSINCGSPVGPVNATTSAGQTFTLQDDGVAPDQVAGDGEFSARWTPSQAFAHIDFTSAAGSERLSTVDLVVQALAGPTQAHLGDRVTLNVTVANTSISAAPASVLNLHLSADGVITAADPLLASVPVPAIAAGASVVLPVELVLPTTGAAGTYFWGAIADPANALGEGNEANNAFAGNAVMLERPSADLTVSGVTAPASSTAGSQITVSATVVNSGTGPAGASTLSFYLSSDTTITTADTLVGTATINPLAAGASQLASGAVTVPAALAAGNYTIGAIADSAGMVVEADEANNARAGSTVVVAQPAVDLTLTAVGNPSTAKNAVAIKLTATLKNAGKSAAPASRVRWVLSADATITSDDLTLAEVATTTLAAGATRSLSVSAKIPLTVAAGSYYIGAIADPDNTVAETLNTNNARASTTKVAVSYTIDLTVPAVAGPTAAATGAPVAFTATVRNIGAVASGSAVVAFYLSNDATITRADRLIATTTLASLAAKASANVSASATLRTDLPPGTWYVGAFVDPERLVPEASNANNTQVATALLTTTRGPDLVMDSIASATSATRGATLVVTGTVRNQGSGAVGAANDRAVMEGGSNVQVGIYLSRNPTITAADVLIGTHSFNALAAGASRSFTVNATVPAGLGAGTWYIGAIADRTRDLREAVEINNALAGNALSLR